MEHLRHEGPGQSLKNDGTLPSLKLTYPLPSDMLVPWKYIYIKTNQILRCLPGFIHFCWFYIDMICLNCFVERCKDRIILVSTFVSTCINPGFINRWLCYLGSEAPSLSLSLWKTFLFAPTKLPIRTRQACSPPFHLQNHMYSILLVSS